MILRLLNEHKSAHILVFLRAADYHQIKIEPLYDKTNEINYAPIEDSDQTKRIRVLAVRSMGSK